MVVLEEENSLIKKEDIKNGTKVRVISKSTGLPLDQIKEIQVGDVLEIQVFAGKVNGKANNYITAHKETGTSLYNFMPGDLVVVA